MVRIDIQKGVKTGGSEVRSVLSGEEGCQVAAFDLAHRVLRNCRDKMDLLGHFEVGQAKPAEHLEFAFGGGTC